MVLDTVRDAMNILTIGSSYCCLESFAWVLVHKPDANCYKTKLEKSLERIIMTELHVFSLAELLRSAIRERINT